MNDRKYRILVVEDEATDRFIFKRAMAASDISHELIFAENFEQGIAATNGKEYDCIFLDYKLPVGTGLELLKHIRSTKNSSPIYIVTSQEDLKIAIEAMKEGADDYIIKDELDRDGRIAQLVRFAVNKREQEIKRLELEAKLQEAYVQLNTVAANAPVILFTLDREGKFLLAEGKGLSSLGLNQKQILDHTIESLADLPISISDYKRALSGDEFKMVSEWKEFFFEIFYSPIRAGNEITGVLGVVSDVTNHKHAEMNLQKAKKLAEETAKIKEQFLANMSHEIRTPMNGIIGLARALENTPLDPEQSKYLHAIRNCSDNLLVIINDILDFSKIEAGKMNFEKVQFDIHSIADQTLELFQQKADEKSLQLVLEKDSSIPQFLDGDPVRLSQILNNLVSNAIKFTEKGEIRMAMRMASRSNENITIQFEIKDTGIGIPEKALPTIFDSFTQASSDTTRKFGGTGLGLTIVKRLIDLQNGNITVKSKAGSGTTFTFEIAYKVSVEQVVERKEKKEKISISHLRILLAEDNKVNQLVVKKVFESWNTKIDIADNGKIVLDKLRQTDYDLVLMDIQMPEMDGYTAVEIIRNEFPASKRNIPIVAMTAHATTSEREKIKASGMNEYISKPFDPDDLKKKIWQLTKSTEPTLKDEHQKPDELSLKESQDNEPQSTGFSGPSGGNNHSQPSYPKINLSYLKQISDGNDAFVIEMIEMFLNKTPLALDQMKACCNEHKWEELGQIAHRIKPSYAYIGLQDLQGTLSQIENQATEKRDKKMMNELILQIQKSTSDAFEQLRRELVTLR